ncbi:MAG: hypothetical protein KCHDKBKB_01270 [Elusimicrobia bacterium]|nr:hypothetical protein [Elusimicrobiota bacterium]
MNQTIQKGIIVGLVLAFFQASVSVALLKWAWNKKFFYTVWGVSTLARFVFFGFIAFVVYQFTSLDLVATLISLAIATMLFLIVEVRLFLTPKK